MALLTGTAIIVPGATGSTSNTPIDMDAVDKAAIIVPGLIGFARAKKLTPSTVGTTFTDRAGNSVVVAGTTKTLVTDSTYNGKPHVTLDGANGVAPYVPQFNLPTSFTFVAVLNTATLKNGNNILCDTLSGFGFQLACNSAGQLTVDTDGGGSGDTVHNTGLFLLANTTYLVGVSHDATSKTTRVMVGSAVAGFSYVSAVAYAGGQKPLPFGSSVGANNFNFAGGWGMWAFFDRAYGAGGSAEALFAAFVTAAKSHWNV